MMDKILCLIGLHSWERGRGWINLAEGVDCYHDGYKCRRCGKLKDKEQS